MNEGLPRILVVDDSPVNVKVLGQALRDTYEVLVATSGVEALRLASAERPDLILLDVMMPGMDGYEVCQRLKEDPATRELPVIFVTARTDDEDEARGLELGAVDYVMKPFRMAILRARVRTHVELKRHRDRLQALSGQDGLTGIANRRRFDETLAREWRRAVRDRSPLALLLISVDDFRAYNDTWGHQAGDDCLRAVAASLERGARRAADLVARFDGAKFAILLPDSDSAIGEQLARGIRAAVAALPGQGQLAAPITLSIGVADVRPLGGNAQGELLERAGAARSRARVEGDRVVVGESVPGELTRGDGPEAAAASGG